MTFKVGDKVVGNARGYSHRIGDEGVVDSSEGGGYRVVWSDGVYWVRNGGIDLAEPAAPIGKTLAELDVMPGDVVRSVDSYYSSYNDFVCQEIISDSLFEGQHRLYSDQYGRGIFGDDNGLWEIVSRASTAQPKPRMHPDDFIAAVQDFAADNGFKLNMITGRTKDGHHFSMSK